MPEINVKQNTEEWYRERLGKPTASNFHRIITLSGNLSTQRFDYMYELVFERIYRRQRNKLPPSYWAERGKRLEPQAAKKFIEMTGEKAEEIGLVVSDNGKIGCSPDRVIRGTDGKIMSVVEIKCPAPWQHIRYSVMGPESEYKAQMQGQLWLTGAESGWFFSYCPGMPCVPYTVRRDQGFIKAMARMLEEFVQELDMHERHARALGEYSWPVEDGNDPKSGDPLGL